jgi:hypothetical protein
MFVGLISNLHTAQLCGSAIGSAWGGLKAGQQNKQTIYHNIQVSMVFLNF